MDEKKTEGSEQRPPMAKTITERITRVLVECKGVWGQTRITSWERDRLDEWFGKTSLSEKQEAVLAAIEKKAFGEDDG